MPGTARGHPTRLDYSAVSDRLAYVAGKLVYLRSLANPSETTQLNKHVVPTTVARFLPLGRYVASADESGLVHVWDVSGEEPSVKNLVQVISGRINDLAWDADSARIIAVGAGQERYGHAFTADSGNSVGEISGHSAVINAVAIKPNRPYRAVTGADDYGVVFMQGPPFKFNQSLRGNHLNFVRDVAYAPDGAHYASVGADGLCVVYDGKDGSVKHSFTAHQLGVYGVAWIDGASFATCSADCSVKVWLADGTEKELFLLDHTPAHQQLGVVSTKHGLVLVGLSGALYTWTLGEAAPAVILGTQKAVTAVAVHDAVVYAGLADGRIAVWKDGAATLLQTPHTNLVSGLVSAEDGVVSAGWDDALHVDTAVVRLDAQPAGIAYDGHVYVASESQLAVYAGTALKASAPVDYSATCVGAGAGLVAVGGKDGSIHLYDEALVALLVAVAPLRAAVSAIAVSPSGTYIAAGDVAGKIVVYDASGKVVTTRWAFHSGRVAALAWQGDDYCASAGLDEQVIVYSVQVPTKNVRKQNAHYGGVTSVAWQGDNVVSGGNDGAVRVWLVQR